MAIKLAILIAVCFSLPSTISGQCSTMDCPSLDSIFSATPSNQIVNSGDNVTLECQLADDATSSYGNIIGPMPILVWEYLPINSTNYLPVAINSDGDRGFQDGDGANLRIIDVEASLQGYYRCFISACCEGGMIIPPPVTLKVKAGPVIELWNNSDMVNVDTLSDLLILATITGYPEPDVEVRHEGVLIDQALDSRFEFTFDDQSGRLTIRIGNILRGDGGQYEITAFNGINSDSVSFSVFAIGPDLPVLTLPSEHVAVFDSSVSITCSVQNDAYEMGATNFTWRDINDNVISSSGSGIVSALDSGDRTSELTINPFTSDHVGEYKCTVANIRDTVSKTVGLFGPPPPPISPRIMTTGSAITVTWTRPSTTTPITGYVVVVYRPGSDIVESSEVVNVDMDHTSATVTITGISEGLYDVTVSSNYEDIRGSETPRSTVNVEGGFPLPIVAGAAGAAVGLILLVLIIGFAVGLYCYCSCKARRVKNTHQQRWGSEEDKVHQQGAPTPVQNTYTALALHDSSELPPSPLSPMTSSIGIDPKWEFPRENIQLSDVLAEGQFTVLYKGVARNLKDKPCEVAVKSPRDHATEDDLKAFVYEMDVLASIEEHPNIVSLVRVCSVGKPLYMVMEYMCHGDLLGFLRACRGHHGMYTISPGNRYQPPSLQLCSRDLLNMATKIANGMRYLADRKIVHRALCTRNILVGSGMDVKIYNVGSFDVALDNRDGTVDGMVKWMAPETLYDGTNTTYSDVWSFGVTLWELVTVGGSPYGEIQPEDLYGQLQGGMRMPRPTHCAQEVYDIMEACWQKNPTDRPHFAIIHENLDELVVSKLNYLDLRSYDGYAYSQFGDEAPPLSTAL